MIICYKQLTHFSSIENPHSSLLLDPMCWSFTLCLQWWSCKIAWVVEKGLLFGNWVIPGMACWQPSTFGIIQSVYKKKIKIFSLPEGNVPLLQSSSVPWIYKAWWQTPSISNSQEIPCCQSPTWSDFCTTTFLKLGALRKRHLQQPTRKIDDYLKSTTVKLKDLAMIKQRVFSWGLNTLTKKSEKVFSITLMDKNCEHKMLTTLKRKNNNTKRKNNNVYC